MSDSARLRASLHLGLRRARFGSREPRITGTETTLDLIQVKGIVFPRRTVVATSAKERNMLVRVLVATLVMAAAAAPVWAGEGDTSRGAAYATAMCASCHSVTAGKEASPNAAAPPLRDAHITSGEALATFFNTTHPNTGRLLKDTQADDIFSLIQSLKPRDAG